MNNFTAKASIYGLTDHPVKESISISKCISGAIDDIINQIKGGKFTLKATEVRKVP
jgi:hypothetical protein